MGAYSSRFRVRLAESSRPATCTEVLFAIIRLLYYYVEGILGREAMPEVYNPGLDPSSREHYHYFTIPMALNYRRSSYQMWRAALKTFFDPETRFVFYPERVISSSDDDLRHALRKYGLALLPEQHTKIWSKISYTIIKHYGADIRNLFRRHNNSIPGILQEVQYTHKQDFPYLSGNKIANYWLYVMWQYAEPELSGKRSLSVAPDTHVIKSSIMLGLVTPSGTPSSISQEVAEKWEGIFSLHDMEDCDKDVLEKWQTLVRHGLCPIDLHYALWLWSRRNFAPPVHGLLPFEIPIERLLATSVWKRRKIHAGRIILGSSNPAKKEMIESILDPVGIKVIGVDDLGVKLDIGEGGATPQENARRKALAYARILQEPVLSIDNALYLEGLPPEEQPGPYVRRIPGRTGRPSDQDLLKHYIGIIRRLGNEVDGYWEFAIAVAYPDGTLHEGTIISPRKFVSKPSATVLEGYPLESIQIDPETGKYISEMTKEERASFWRRILGEEIRKILQSHTTSNL